MFRQELSVRESRPAVFTRYHAVKLSLVSVEVVLPSEGSLVRTQRTHVLLLHLKMRRLHVPTQNRRRTEVLVTHASIDAQMTIFILMKQQQHTRIEFLATRPFSTHTILISPSSG